MTDSSFPAALRLLEDAIALVKQTDAASWFIYLIGVVPFFALLLYEITNVEQSPFAAEQILAVAVVLALLLLWMHICQAVFCARLYEIHGELEKNIRREFRDAAGVQAVIAGTKVWAWPIGVCLLIPHAAFTMFYQSSLIATGDGWRQTVHEARQDAAYRASVGVWLVIVTFLLRTILWMNLVVLLFSMPGLWKMLTGMETDITRWPELLNNATALSAVTVLAYLALDPVIKAACVLRRFERQSLGSGLDLRLRLKVLLRTVAVITLLISASGTRGWAVDTKASVVSVASRPPITPERMHRALSSVFHDPAEAWNLPLVERRKKSTNPVFAFMDALSERAGKWWKDVDDWLRRLMERQRPAAPQPSHGPATGASAWLLVSLFLGLVGAGVLLAWWRRSARSAPAEVAAAPVAIAFDVASETVLADEQPEDEWARLVAEYRGNGNLRLALRAMYLSILAALARASLITVARGKSNRIICGRCNGAESV